MVSIAVYWPDAEWLNAHPGAPKRWLSFFIFAMQAFGAEKIILIGGENIEHGYDIEYEHYERIEDVLDTYGGIKLVVLDGNAEKTLQEYEHPKDNVLYIIGNDYGGAPNISGADKIRIGNNQEHKDLWSHNCVSILLYDRSLKIGSSE